MVALSLLLPLGWCTSSILATQTLVENNWWDAFPSERWPTAADTIDGFSQQPPIRETRHDMHSLLQPMVAGSSALPGRFAAGASSFLPLNPLAGTKHTQEQTGISAGPFTNLPYFSNTPADDVSNFNLIESLFPHHDGFMTPVLSNSQSHQAELWPTDADILAWSPKHLSGKTPLELHWQRAGEASPDRLISLLQPTVEGSSALSNRFAAGSSPPQEVPLNPLTGTRYTQEQTGISEGSHKNSPHFFNTPADEGSNFNLVDLLLQYYHGSMSPALPNSQSDQAIVQPSLGSDSNPSSPSGSATSGSSSVPLEPVPVGSHQLDNQPLHVPSNQFRRSKSFEASTLLNKNYESVCREVNKKEFHCSRRPRPYPRGTKLSPIHPDLPLGMMEPAIRLPYPSPARKIVRVLAAKTLLVQEHRKIEKLYKTLLLEIHQRHQFAMQLYDKTEFMNESQAMWLDWLKNEVFDPTDSLPIFGSIEVTSPYPTWKLGDNQKELIRYFSQKFIENPTVEHTATYLLRKYLRAHGQHWGIEI
ncbi:hypothetical protein PtB15_11B501 [Puccinia triticina]|nr:hypothetical protein PtB15_11B501 [Puccinia triticina]